ncbi:MAG: ABC transporter ATP-binding protein [Anaerolineales bacterium]|nr:ABC transporter ATP-binding protein [Anaerolineales bacterium]
MLEVERVGKWFEPGKLVLDGVSLAVRDGEIACLLGPSGCGKSTLLRVIAGLETPDASEIRFDGEDVTALEPYRRRFGLMFQDYALFPHMSVSQNVGFGLRMANLEQRTIARRVQEVLELVNLQGYGERSVDRLSGGEQQRVALARTLAPAPRLVMLDEPLANLDRLLREDLVEDLRVILRRVGATAIVVTHDQQEAFVLADHVAVMRQGQIVQEGSPEEVYQNPASRFVADFLGYRNLIAATKVEGAAGAVFDTAIGPISTARFAEAPLGWHGWIVFRPDAATLARGGADELKIEGKIRTVSFRGPITRIQLAPAFDPGVELVFDIPSVTARELPHLGDEVAVALHADGLSLIPAEPKRGEPLLNHIQQRK